MELKEKLTEKQSSYDAIKKRLSSFGEQRAKLEETLKELEKTQTCLRFFGYDECVKYKFFTHDIYKESMKEENFDIFD